MRGVLKEDGNKLTKMHFRAEVVSLLKSLYVRVALTLLTADIKQ